MILVVAVLVLMTIGIVALALAPRIAERRVVFDVRPDRPVAFGFKMAWIAVRSTDTAAVRAELDLATPERANWDSGIGTVYDDKLGERRIFVSPPVEGWTFVVGLALPTPMSGAFVDKWTPLMDALAGRFGDVQYYFSYPLIDFYAWARYVKGRPPRAFAISDAGVVRSVRCGCRPRSSRA